jgi:hypothetical protein
MATTYRTYPGLALDDAIKKLRAMYERAGRGPSTKEAYILGLGYKSVSGASSRVFAALIHFGLVDKAGSQYKISDLAMQILYPREDQDVQSLLRQAALRPKVFGDVYSKYEGEKLPMLLNNSFIHDFRIHDRSAKDAADIFKRTVAYAGLLDDEGIVKRMEVEPAPSPNFASSQVSTTDQNRAESRFLQQVEPTRQDVAPDAYTPTAVRRLPSGIQIAFPEALDYEVLSGEFGPEIKALEAKAQGFLTGKRGGGEDM